MKKIACFLFILLITHCSIAQENANVEKEVNVFQSLLNDLYNVGHCQRFVTPPYYACCNGNQHMAIEDHVACCQESDIPEKYRIYCQECINIGELDTLDIVVEVLDTLYPLDFEEYKDWIIENLDSNSVFLGFISRGVFSQKKAGFDLSALSQEFKVLTIRNKDDKRTDFSRESISPKKVQFMKREEVKKIDKKRRLGKSGKQIIAGAIGLSRVYFDETGNKVFFYFAYSGNRNCGFEQIVLAEKKQGDWKISQTIPLNE